MENFADFFEGTVAGDIAQATPGSKIQKRKRKGDCPCKDLDGQAKADCKKQKLLEASRNVRKLENALKSSISYSGDYKIEEKYTDFYNAGVIVSDNSGNKFKIEIEEI